MKTFKIILICIFSATLAFVAFRSSLRGTKAIYETTQPQYREIKEEINISGNVFPMKEIEIKSQISGVLDKINVSIGDKVRIGDPVASIMLVPNASDMERLEYNLNTAQIEYKARLEDYKREHKLYSKNLVAQAEMDSYTQAYELSKEKLASAQNQLNILKEGRISPETASNIVRSSISGVIIDTPLETGASVIERNNFNPGTTIAVVAEMSRFRFKALVPEKYLKDIALQDTISLLFNAYDNLRTRAVVTKISSKGNAENGIMKYMLEAEFPVSENMPVIRSGYSATANMVIKQKRHTLSIDEKYVLYENDSTYLYLLDTVTQQKTKQIINIGISDGNYVEVIKGISLKDKIVTNSTDK